MKQPLKIGFEVERCSRAEVNDCVALLGLVPAINQEDCNKVDSMDE